ncbi:succinate-semialdehyde dehydrogenase (NADP(+)) [Aeromicrobium sp. YIM 150415]|uniref:succinic semialdehyde dehydrogenase n=1 Tax=Aeromicrobium sp. YIM 150415 TaxID=2803912 RepID=UPI0019649E25|nr:succinic semialdehyde dehydrogenase [Aeromicrobium sp. YIM 150415]MBM9462004.1 succinate-semialdehyde dehydrogenase (NADP(+)) [Aeromicrobium sp. YIM 150415]
MLDVSQVTSPVSDDRVRQLTALIRTSIDETRRTVSPLTGDEIATVPVSSVDDVAAAFEAARRAQRTWARTSPQARQQMLLRLHDLVLDRQEELLDLIQLESGKSRAHAFDEIAHLALTARYYGRRLAKIVGPHRRSGVYPGLTSVRQVQQPKGVVGVISPWNYPLTMAISDGLAAVAAGNAVVHKPDSQSPLTALAGVELLREAGFPPELWQVVSGQGSVVGHAIIERADYICFTGSTATGKRVAGQCAERLIGCSLELGGKNPMIVLPGANVEKAAAGAVTAAFSSAGQLCVSIERIYIHRRQYAAFRDALVRRVQSMSFGTALDWEADMGTLVSPAQLATIEKHVDDAIAQGATVLVGGRARPELGPWFYEPTVLEGVTPAAECFAEETFGPLVSLYSYDTVDEAVAFANSGVYGLNASVWGPARTARRVAARLKAGTVNVNEGFAATFGSIDAPMGGMRESGTGRRQGAEGLLRFTESQAIGAQRLMPVGGPPFIGSGAFSKLMTLGLRLLKKAGKA